jgi:hypothetical protein
VDAWQRDVAEGAVPARLFPLCYSSWSFVFVELAAPDLDDGGALFEWMYGGADFELTYDDVEDWIDVQLQAVEEGRFELAHGKLRFPWMGQDPLHGQGQVRLLRRGPHPVYGTTTSIPEFDWPPRWR